MSYPDIVRCPNCGCVNPMFGNVFECLYCGESLDGVETMYADEEDGEDDYG